MRVGIGTRLGGVSLFASKSVHPGNAVGGCLMLLLKLCILPFWLLYLYIRWCIKNNSECDDVPVYRRPWVIITVCLVIVMSVCSFISSDSSESAGGSEPPPTSSVSQVVATTPEPTAEPTPEPTAEPTPEPTEEPTPEPTAEPTEAPAPAPAQETMVWMPTNGGERYHRKADCSGMKDPVQIPLSEAEAQGYGPCGRCY